MASGNDELIAKLNNLTEGEKADVEALERLLKATEAAKEAPQVRGLAII